MLPPGTADVPARNFAGFAAVPDDARETRAVPGRSLL
jgi:hypothetical protein